jgi:hypothetical protein
VTRAVRPALLANKGDALAARAEEGQALAREIETMRPQGSALGNERSAAQAQTTGQH